MIEHIIAKGTVYAFLKQKKSFKLQSLFNEIILRVSMCVTIKEYLNELENNNVIKYCNKNEEYVVL